MRANPKLISTSFGPEPDGAVTLAELVLGEAGQ